MKKVERINDLLFFLADKNSFNLKELMERYQISKSTALRDIESLEEIGLPLYSELGRYGKYTILDTKIAAPILFTEGEMYALYFSLLTLNGYKSIPFNAESDTLEKKYRHVLPQKLQEKLTLMNQIVVLEQTNHSRVSRYLKEIVQGIIDEAVFEMVYSKEGRNKHSIVQFIQLTSKFGQWYAKIWNFETEKIRIIRCDKIKDLHLSKKNTAKSITELLSQVKDLKKRSSAISFSVIVNEKGSDIFTKENYPSMKMEPYQENYRISGSYDASEVEFIAAYFIRFGESILSIEPEQLKVLVTNKLKSLLTHFETLH